MDDQATTRGLLKLLGQRLAHLGHHLNPRCDYSPQTGTSSGHGASQPSGISRWYAPIPDRYPRWFPLAKHRNGYACLVRRLLAILSTSSGQIIEATCRALRNASITSITSNRSSYPSRMVFKAASQAKQRGACLLGVIVASPVSS